MTTKLTIQEVSATPITEGDAGIILKTDGTFQIFNTHRMIGSELTATQLAQGEKLLALACALQHPEIMDTLIKMSNDPNVGVGGIDRGKQN